MYIWDVLTNSVRLDKQSEDVRDKLLQSFFQALGGESSWLLVRFIHNDFNLGASSDISISPIKPDELKHLSIEALSRIEASSK